MSDLDALLERGRQPGAFVERRRFTLSRDKAIAKIREFSLRHPQQYILELIQSAVFAGADHIAIDTRPEHMLIAFVGGRSLDESELQGLFDYLFADRADPETRHLVQLAIGVNAILQRKPRRLRIESGDGRAGGSVRLDLNAAGEGTIGRPEQPLNGTYVLVEHPGAWLKRFRTTRLTTEQALIEERCLYTPVPILVNTEAPFGYRPTRKLTSWGSSKSVVFDHGDRRGVLAVAVRGADRPGVRLVVGGVWINTVAMPELGQLARRDAPDSPGLVIGVICDDALRKTADQSDIVRDRRWHAMIHAVQPEATHLIRKLTTHDYVPPALAPLPPEIVDAPKGPAGPVPEDLGVKVRLLGRAGTVAVDRLDELPIDTQVFWVQPDAEHLLATLGDPARFPHLVLVLRPGQALTLAQHAPGLQLHRLTTPADVEFVRNALARRTRRLTVDVAPGPAGLPGVLSLTLVLAGDRPTWSLAGPDQIPCCVTRSGRTAGLFALDTALPGLTVQLEVPDDLTALPDAAAMAAGVEREAWRVLAATPDLLGEPAARLLLQSLLALHSRQFLVRDGAGLRCEPALPPSWGHHAARFLDTPILDTDAGPRSLAQLGVGDRALTPTGSAPTPALERLELRLCPGRLAWSDLADLWVLRVGELRTGWRVLGPGHHPLPRAIVGVTAAGTGADLEGVTSPCPGVLASSGAQESLDQGLEALYDALLARDLEGDWHRALPPRVSVERARVLGRQALVRLAVLLGRSDAAPLLISSLDDSRDSLAHWQERAGFRVAPTAGAGVCEAATALLAPQEILALEAVHGVLPLRFDDPPSVWEALTDPSDRGWLVRQEVVLDGVHGWVGLRHPHDPTSAVLIERATGLQALPDLEEQVPCHGLLRIADPDGELGAVHVAMLRLFALQLYQRLAAGAGQDDPERAASAWQYGATFVLATWARQGGQALSGAAARLARQLTLPGRSGESWGTLERWLQLPRAHRPALPGGLQLPTLAALSALDRPDDALPMLRAQDELESVLGELGSPLQVLVMSERRRSSDLVRVDARASHLQLAVLAVNSDHPLFQKALAHPTGRSILLLEMAREVSGLAARQGRPVPLKTLHRALMARRLVGS